MITILVLIIYETLAVRYETLLKKRFNIKLIKRAITEGEDEEGKKINPNMPLWNMSDNELNDVIEFLKQL